MGHTVESHKNLGAVVGHTFWYSCACVGSSLCIWTAFVTCFDQKKVGTSLKKTYQLSFLCFGEPEPPCRKFRHPDGETM